MYSPLMSPTYNQDLNIPMYEEDETENCDPGRFVELTRHSEKENVHQKEDINSSEVYLDPSQLSIYDTENQETLGELNDYFPNEDGIPPLQTTNGQLFNQNPETSMNFEDILPVQQGDDVFNLSENYFNPEHSTENQEKTGEYNDYIPQEDGIPPLEHSNSEVFDQNLPMNSGQMVQTPSNVFNPQMNNDVYVNPENSMNYGQITTVQQPTIGQNQSNGYQKGQQPSNVFNHNDVFYNPPHPSHHQKENSNVYYRGYNDILQKSQNNSPILYELPYNGESSSSHPIQSKKRPTKRSIEETLDDDKRKYKEFYSIESMDTQQVSQAVFNKINQLKLSQNVIAEKIIERSQGTLSDLLKKPKDWNKLITIGKDTYRRMYMFLKLSDQEMKRIEEMSVEEVQQMMNFPPTIKTAKRSKQTDENDPNGSEKKGNKRISYNETQKKYLEGLFSQNARPTKEAMNVIAQSMGLTLVNIENWFGNARRRQNGQNNANTTQFTYFEDQMQYNNGHFNY